MWALVCGMHPSRKLLQIVVVSVLCLASALSALRNSSLNLSSADAMQRGEAAILFFDDYFLTHRQSVDFHIGTAELVAEYRDPTCFVGWGFPSVWSVNTSNSSGRFRMLYVLALARVLLDAVRRGCILIGAICVGISCF